MRLYLLLSITSIFFYNMNAIQAQSRGEVAHRPYLNPGGQNFEEDKEFYKSYNKIQQKQLKNNEQILNFEQEDNIVPGAVLLDTQYPQEFKKRNQGLFKNNCIENHKLPEDLESIIENKCESLTVNTNSQIISESYITSKQQALPEIPDLPKIPESKIIEYSSLPKIEDYSKTLKVEDIKKSVCENDYEVISLDKILNDCENNFYKPEAYKPSVVKKSNKFRGI